MLALWLSAPVVRVIAVLHKSSNASFNNSPVTAEHSTYRSARRVCATWYPSCGYIIPFGSCSDLRSRFSPRMIRGRVSMRWNDLLISSFHYQIWVACLVPFMEYLHISAYWSNSIVGWCRNKWQWHQGQGSSSYQDMMCRRTRIETFWLLSEYRRWKVDPYHGAWESGWLFHLHWVGWGYGFSMIRRGIDGGI